MLYGIILLFNKHNMLELKIALCCEYGVDVGFYASVPYAKGRDSFPCHRWGSPAPTGVQNTDTVHPKRVVQRYARQVVWQMLRVVYGSGGEIVESSAKFC